MESDKIMEMLPSELNLEIWQVLGWKKVPNCAPKAQYWQLTPAGSLHELIMPDYANRIEWAWKLVEDAENNDISFKMINVIPSSDSIIYEFEFKSAVGHYYGFGDTAPLAISRAWLVLHNEQ